MTRTTKSVAAATAAAVLGLGVAVFWPEPPPPTHFAPRLEFEIDSNDVGAVTAWIESSTNLLDWKTEVVFTVAQRSNVWTDSNAFAPAKFYRAGVNWNY